MLLYFQKPLTLEEEYEQDLGLALYLKLRKAIIDPTNVQVNETVAVGTFGKVNRGTLIEGHTPSTVVNYAAKIDKSSEVVAIKFLNCKYFSLQVPGFACTLFY